MNIYGTKRRDCRVVIPLASGCISRKWSTTPPPRPASGSISLNERFPEQKLRQRQGDEIGFL